MGKEAKGVIVYKGKKAWIPVCLPIGVKSQGGVIETLKAVPGENEGLLSEDDCHKLVALDSHNFGLKGGEESKYVYQDGKFYLRGEEPKPEVAPEPVEEPAGGDEHEESSEEGGKKKKKKK